MTTHLARIYVDRAFESSRPNGFDRFEVKLVSAAARSYKGRVIREDHARMICRLFNPLWSRAGFTISYRRVRRKGGVA